MKYANLEYCLEYKLEYKEVLHHTEDLTKNISEGNSVYEELSYENRKIVAEALKAGDTVEVGRVSVWEPGQEYRNELTDRHYVFIRDQQRIGIGYSDSLAWADVESPKEGLDLFFHNREAFDNRN